MVIDKADEAATLKALFDWVRFALKKSEGKPLHFRKMSHHQRIPYVSQIAGAPLTAINIIVNKQSVWRERFDARHRLYHYAVRLLSERISWLCRDRKRSVGDGSVELVFSNRGGMSYTAIGKYLDSLIDRRSKMSNAPDVRIAPGTIDGSKVRTFRHEESRGVQVADAVASSFYNALEAKYGFTEDRYARMLKPIVYNNRGRYRVYGLKFFPPPAEKLIETDPRLKWVVEDYSK